MTTWQNPNNTDWQSDLTGALWNDTVALWDDLSVGWDEVGDPHDWYTANSTTFSTDNSTSWQTPNNTDWQD